MPFRVHAITFKSVQIRRIQHFPSSIAVISNASKIVTQLLRTGAAKDQKYHLAMLNKVNVVGGYSLGRGNGI
jgi:hypothetical protein